LGAADHEVAQADSDGVGSRRELSSRNQNGAPITFEAG